MARRGGCLSQRPGVGEGGTVAATPTVMNATLDATAPLGVTDVPICPPPPNTSGARFVRTARADADPPASASPLSSISENP
jgi:hypothetical protein